MAGIAGLRKAGDIRVKPHRQYGMTRPPWLLVVVAIAVVTAVVAALMGLSLLAWSLGGILAGALMMTFDAKRKKNGG